MKKLPYFLIKEISLLNDFLKRYKAYQILFAIIILLFIIYVHMRLYQVSEFKFFFDSFYPYILKLLHSINIPIAIIIVAFIFRSPLSQLINNNWEVDYKNMKIKVSVESKELLKNSFSELEENDDNDSDSIENDSSKDQLQIKKRLKLDLMRHSENDVNQLIEEMVRSQEAYNSEIKKFGKNSISSFIINSKMTKLNLLFKEILADYNIKNTKLMDLRWYQVTNYYKRGYYDNSVREAWKLLITYFKISLRNHEALIKNDISDRDLIKTFANQLTFNENTMHLIYEAYNVQNNFTNSSKELFNLDSAYDYILSILIILKNIEENKKRRSS